MKKEKGGMGLLIVMGGKPPKAGKAPKPAKMAQGGGVAVRGKGAATKGFKARGPMA